MRCHNGWFHDGECHICGCHNGWFHDGESEAADSKAGLEELKPE
jgi:hypothetical protein